VPYRWVEHTGELELELRAGTEAEIFEEALLAMAELMSEGELGEAVERSVSLTAPDGAALLADWVGELAFLAESEGLVPFALDLLELSGGALQAGVRGRRGEPPNLVKGVTYHRLELAPADGAWLARVVLDV
jgi:SHS2 domain-containing protein